MKNEEICPDLKCISCRVDESCGQGPEPVPPAGDVEVVAEVVNKYGDPEAFAERDLLRRSDIDNLKIGTELVDRAHVTRLTAERDGLLAKIANLRSLLSQAAGMVNGASSNWHDTVTKELSRERI